jgi:hypothetical protein
MQTSNNYFLLIKNIQHLCSRPGLLRTHWQGMPSLAGPAHCACSHDVIASYMGLSYVGVKITLTFMEYFDKEKS